MANIQEVQIASKQLTDQQTISDLHKKISDLTLQLNERDAKIEDLTATLEDLDQSRHSSVCRYHVKRARRPNAADTDNVILPEMEEPPIIEQPIISALPPHFSETWALDTKYQDEMREAYMGDVDPFFVLAETDFLTALSADPLTKNVHIMQFSLDDESRPYGLLTFYGIFLNNTTYSKELDVRLNEMMRETAAKWHVEEKPMRYMVWNDEIEDEQYISESDGCDEIRRSEIRYQLLKGAGLV